MAESFLKSQSEDQPSQILVESMAAAPHTNQPLQKAFSGTVRSEHDDSELRSQEDEDENASAKKREVPKASSFIASKAQQVGGDVVEVQIKFIDYVPPRRFESTSTGLDAEVLLRKEPSINDAVAENLGDQAISTIGELNQGSISDIIEPAKQNFLTQNSMESTGSLMRMTTSRQIFEAIQMNITQNSFRDIFNAVKESRDLSQGTMRRMFEGKMANKPLTYGESLQVSAVLQIEDCYDLDQHSDEDIISEDDPEQLVVFDSTYDNPSEPSPSIKEVLQHKQSILAQALADNYLYLEFKLVLSVTGRDDGQAQNVQSGQNQNQLGIKRAPTINIDQMTLDDEDEPASPTAFHMNASAVNRLARQTVRRAAIQTRKGSIAQKREPGISPHLGDKSISFTAETDQSRGDSLIEFSPVGDPSEEDDEVFLVQYFDSGASESNFQCQLKVQSSFLGGIIVVRADEADSPDSQVYSALWKDCNQISFQQDSLELLLNNATQSKVRFSNQGDFIYFKSKFELFAPKDKPFQDFNASFVARKSTCRQARRLTQAVGGGEMDDTLDDMKDIAFEVHAHKHQFLIGWTWKPHYLVLEESINEPNFWSVSVFTIEDFQSQSNPDECFLLKSVRQLLTTTDADGHKLVSFEFRENMQPVKLKILDKNDYQMLINKLKYIIAKWEHQERKLFILQQSSLTPISETIRLPHVSSDWLKCEQMTLVDQLSQRMRQNHVNLGLADAGTVIPQVEDATMVKWVTTEVHQDGQTRPCNPSIRFKCLLYLSTKECMKVYIRAELQRNSDGAFIHKSVIFTISQALSHGEQRWDAFSREQVRQFYVSRTNNRAAKLQVQNKRRNGYNDITIVFQNVHKLFQFAALLNIGDDYPAFRTIGSLRQPEEESKEPAQPIESDVADLKVLACTWNMGGSTENIIQHQLDTLLPNPQDYDLIFVSSQECLGNRMTNRIHQLEFYLKSKGFENIDTQNSYVYMFQMFLICFVKSTLSKEVSRVMSQRVAKGKNLAFTTVGNKGGLCYSFVLKNRIFNVIGCHLQHKQEKQAKRNKMSRDLVNEMKMQDLQFKMQGLVSDQLGDFCFYMGDLNYRLKSSFTELNNTNVRDLAVSWIPTKDQLVEAMSEGYYPGYAEMPITFIPSYKMSTNEESYVNKKDQAPSYCDRCLFKNNLLMEYTSDFYRCIHNCHGSDHRPVQLGITLKNFGQPRFQDLARLVNTDVPRQGYGELTVKMVSISNFDFSKSFILSKFMIPTITDATQEAHKLHFRVAFYDFSLDRVTAPVTYSEQTEIQMGGQNPQFRSSLDEVALNWMDEQLPTLHSAYNTVELVSQSRLLMTIWAGGHAMLVNETMVAQASIPLAKLQAQTQADGRSEMFLQVPIVAENLKIGTAHFKIAYRQK